VGEFLVEDLHRRVVARALHRGTASSTRRIDMRFDLLAASIFSCAACGASSPTAPPHSPPPDAPATTIPRTIAGTFGVSSEIDVPLPAAASAALAPITAAIDGSDDPSRYVLEQMVAQIPDGTLKTIAADAVPLLAPYVNTRLAEVAPRLVPGLHALAQGLDHITRHFGSIESWQIAASGDTRHILSGARFAIGGTPVEVRFADHGLDDRVAMTRVMIDDRGGLSIGQHELPLGYSAVVRLGLDYALVPSVDPGATDLPGALADLIDCKRLSELVASELGIGTPALFRTACIAATIAIADDVYARIAAVDAAAPLELELTGTATGIDADHDGAMDDVRAGTWTGTLVSVGPIGTATFTGEKLR
jgi:hypothetical protein